MKQWMGNETEIKERSGEDMVIFLDQWKEKVRRYRIYRYLLIAILTLSVIALSCMTLYQIDSKIPSVLHVRANEEQSLHLGVPAKAEIIGVSNQGESNIPRDAITIDLSKAITVKAGDTEQYQMNVKLFGILPFKQVGIEVIHDKELIPVGAPIGIYMKTDGILVVGVGEFVGADGRNHAPAENILQSGDYIHKLNGEEVIGKTEFMDRIAECGGEKIVLTVERNEEIMDVSIQPEQNKYGIYKIGTWIRDNSQGVGTMTYIDSEGNFGALGHGINDTDTGLVMEIEDGTLYQTEIVSIRKGAGGDPGEMTGMIVYSDDKILGDIDTNSEEGIFGTCNQRAMTLTQEKAYPIGLKQEIQKGPAQIICTVDGVARYYDIEIADVRLDHHNVNRGIELKITDQELLSITGGIVQGMSGSPIIQDGKIVGAVTHVLVNDPTRGYGIFIEAMLEH